MGSNLLMLLVGAMALILAVAFILTHKHSEQIKEWMVGAAAGFDFAQIAHVHLFTIATVFWLLTSNRPIQRKVSSVTVWLLASATLLAATAFVGPLTVNHTLALQLIALAVTAAIIGVKATPQAIQSMAYGLLTVCLFSACWAILQKLGFLPIRQFNAVEGAGRVMGIYREPDWLGLFCAAGIVTALRLNLPRIRKVTFVSILGLALLYSLARASVLALGIAAIVAVVANMLTKSDTVRRSRNRQVLAVLASIAVGVFVLSPGLSNKVVGRFQSAFNATAQDVGAQARRMQDQSLRFLAHNAPWYGDGLSAAGRVGVSGIINYGIPPASHAVSSDWVLGWWVDGKYLALPLIAIFCLLALRSANRWGGQLLVVVLVTSLVSDAVMVPITWFAVGLCLYDGAFVEDDEQSHAFEQESVTSDLASEHSRLSLPVANC